EDLDDGVLLTLVVGTAVVSGAVDEARGEIHVTEPCGPAFDLLGRGELHCEIQDFLHVDIVSCQCHQEDVIKILDDEGSSVANPLLDPSQRSEEHTSELQSRENLVCRLLLEKK